MIQSNVNYPELVRAVVESNRDKRGVLIEILHEIQRRTGYVDSEVVPLLAAQLNLSRADVHGVVTFYRDFRSRPAGRTTVRVCRAEACQSVGAQQLSDSLERAFSTTIGQTTPDGSVTIEQVFCLGNCALGPAACRQNVKMTTARQGGFYR